MASKLSDQAYNVGVGEDTPLAQGAPKKLRKDPASKVWLIFASSSGIIVQRLSTPQRYMMRT